MKIILALALALFMLLPLAGCSQPPVQEHLDWKSIPNHSTVGALSEQGYYYTEGGILHYADLATGQSVTLCSLPGCAHEDEDCEAHLDTGWGGTMFFTNDRLFYFDKSGELYSRSSIGTEEKLVGVPCIKYLEEGGAINSFKMVSAGNWLYYRAIISYKDADSSEISSITTLGRMDLTTGKDEILVEKMHKEGMILDTLDLGAIRENGMLFIQCDGIPGSIDDADYSEKSQSAVMKLRYWDASTGEATTLLEKPRKELLAVSMVYGSKVYFYGAGNGDGTAAPLSVYDLNTGTVEIKPDMRSISRWLGGPYATLVGGQLINLDTWEQLPREGGGALALAMSASGFVTWANGLEYYYIPYSAMADGIQQADLIPLVTAQ